MTQRSCSRPSLALTAAAALVFSPAFAGGQRSVAASTVSWDTAFLDRSGDTPLHFVAHYVDGHGTSHRLEEWRVGQTHLRRRTDDRIDLHADAAGLTGQGQPPEYLWQILDLGRHVAHRVSTAGMLHLGMLYSYYSMAHLLTRPAGVFTVQGTTKPVPAPPAAAGSLLDAGTRLPPCTWWQIDASGQTPTRVCWSARYGLPAEMWSLAPGGWRRTFLVERVVTDPLPASTFAVSTRGFQVRDVDEVESDD